MAGFTQIIEMQTSRIDEVEALIRERLVRTGAGDGTVTADGDRDGLYLSIVEFDSYETAMRTRLGQRSASTQAG